ncbi:type II secretion system F family protein [Ferrimonas pelagia]|uniref:Type II secretion system F family protein n=1 Tax=Ferrimonas pelagia TaxID=1177826 RepID=A0ABP9EHT9_9GAMM
MDYLFALIKEGLQDQTYYAYVIYVVAGLAGVTLAISIAYIISGLYSPFRQRLAKLNSAGGGVQASGDFDNSLEHSLNSTSGFSRYFLFGGDEIKRRLVHAGYHSDSALAVYNGTRILFAFIMLLIGLAVLQMNLDVEPKTEIYIMVVLCSLGFLLPSFVLDRLADERMRAMRIGFPDALDILVVCCEAGQGLMAGLQKVALELQVSHPKLSDELILVCQKVRAGFTIDVALKEFVSRTGLEEIKGLNSAITQSMKLGTGIAETLRVYAEEYRDKRMQAAEEQAAKLGVKMIFPMVLCIWPSFFIVAVGPAILKVLQAWNGTS